MLRMAEVWARVAPASHGGASKGYRPPVPNVVVGEDEGCDGRALGVDGLRYYLGVLWRHKGSREVGLSAMRRGRAWGRRGQG